MTNIGDRVFIPRIIFIPNNLHLPFDIKRRQFPIRLAFGMTNKSQGQTMFILGLYLATPIFNHGQLYVAFSYVQLSNAVKVFLPHNADHTNVGNSMIVCTRNVVYKEVLQLASIKCQMHSIICFEFMKKIYCLCYILDPSKL